VKKSIGVGPEAVIAPFAAIALLLAPGLSSATSHPESALRAEEETLTVVRVMDPRVASRVSVGEPTDREALSALPSIPPVQPLEVLEEADRVRSEEAIQIAGPVRRAVRRADRRHDRRESRRDRRDDRSERVEDRRDDRRERVEDRRDERKERWR
jgi:hypothetical protein